MKGFLKVLLLAIMPLFFDGGEGGGGDAGASNDGGGATDGGGQAAAQAATPAATADPNVVSIPKEVLEQLTSTVGEMATERANAAAERDIASRVPGFSLSAVHQYLKEMHKTDPAGAMALNNPKGWEMVYKAEIAPAKVEADAVNHGRKAADNPERDGIVSKLRSGDGSLGDRANLFEQYL